MKSSLSTKSARPYFHKYGFRAPQVRARFDARSEALWHFFAIISICFGIVYIHWRVTASFNPDVAIFSVSVMAAEVLSFAGLILFYFDIWGEGDAVKQAPPSSMSDLGQDQERPVTVDIFITTFDEPIEVVRPSVEDACSLHIPQGCRAEVHLLDDGHRKEMQKLAEATNISYLKRHDNRGFKAGNLKEAILASEGDFIVICDADTRLFPTFLENTLGYFRDPDVSWVQTPHWFYDLPEGQNKYRIWRLSSPSLAKKIARVHKFIFGHISNVADPFMNDPDFFFDVIQRRRNRNAASFCCGAGSIHRREALLKVALQDHSESITRLEKKISRHDYDNPAALPRLVDPRPFEFHVSEDLFTSIRHHRRGWKSVYHPQVEAKMLSPRQISSWTLQRMKYAGGTYDIMLRSNPMFMSGISWQTKLHYASTFWSYISVLWLPILLLSPAISLLTGWSPITAYSLEFFQHLIPFLIAHEIAIMIASKGHNANLGRTMNIGLLPMHLKAAWNVILGRKPNFVPTPKIPIGKNGAHVLLPHYGILAIFVVAAINGVLQFQAQDPNFSAAFVITNLLWLGWNFSILWRTAKIAFWHEINAGPTTAIQKGLDDVTCAPAPNT